MKRKIEQTADGSPTFFVPELSQHYHSTHGALQESLHVFIKAGLHFLAEKKSNISILEVGFGTGLNSWLTALEAERLSLEAFYEGLEKFPLSEKEYSEFANSLHENQRLFYKLHKSPWEKPLEISENFALQKTQTDLKNFSVQKKFDLIYFDAFAPSAQPDLWTEAIFKKMYDCLNDGGVLVTYCVKGDVRRAMKAAGFEVVKIPGPPGKREMSRALRF